MKETMDQWNQMMEKMWSPWQKMMTDMSWPGKPDIPFQGKWSTWFAAMRASYETNIGWWQTFIEQSEEMFFKVFKDSPMYSASLEQQLRDLYDGIKKAQSSQQDLVKEQLKKMESLLKDKES